MVIGFVALGCAVLASTVAVQASPTATRSGPTASATADAHGLQVPIYFNGKALHPRNRNMNEDQLSEWLTAENNKLKVKYTHPKDRQPSTRSKRQQLGLGDFGLDSFYFAPIGVGSPELTLNVVLDTGSADFWVAGTSCSLMDQCQQGMIKFDPSKSSTFKDNGLPFSVQYGSGAVRGELASDKVSLAGYTISSLSFGLAKELARNTIGPPASGILGMAFNTLSTTGTMPFWQVLLERRKMQNYVFSFQLVNNLEKANSQDAKEVAPGGVFTLGVLDDQQYSGNITWSSLSKGYGPNGVGYWAIDIEKLNINGKELKLGELNIAAIDTGTTLIGGPESVMTAIHSRIRGAQIYARAPQYYVFPCRTQINLDFTFGGRTWKLTTKDLISHQLTSNMCLSSLFISPTQSPNMPSWIVGDTFLKTVFSVFDGAKARIGFASLHQGGAQTMSLTSATMDNSLANKGAKESTEAGPMSDESSAGMPHGGNTPGVARSNTDNAWKTASIFVPHDIKPIDPPKGSSHFVKPANIVTLLMVSVMTLTVSMVVL